METGILKRSPKFHTTHYWVVKCDNPNLDGNIDGELPIDYYSFKMSPWKLSEGLKVNFELVELGYIQNFQIYARLK